MHALVTGGAGFIGSNLVRRLLDDGHAVRVLDDFATGFPGNLSGLDVEMMEGSVADAATAAAAVDGIEVVFHEAALPSVVRSVRAPLPSHHANATGVLTMLVAAKDAGVRRFVYASSSSVYGNSAELPKRETMPTAPISPYAVSKLAGEHYCQVFSGVYGLETVSLRYFNVFGPRQSPSGGYAGVVARFVGAALEGEAPTIFGTGSQTRDFTFVDNVVDANLAAAAAPPTVAGEAMNVACGERISVLELWQHIAGITDTDPRYEAGPARPGDVSDSLADITKATKLIGYRPRVGVHEGLARTVEWFAANRMPAPGEG